MAQVEPGLFPEFPGVCQEAHGEFETFLEGLLFAAGFRLFFGRQDAFFLQPGDLFFVSRHHMRRLGLDDPVGELRDLALDRGGTAGERFPECGHLCAAHLPGGSEHLVGRIEQLLARLQGLQQFLEFALQIRPADRLAAARAALSVAKVIGVLLAGPRFRPAGGERVAAIAAEHHAPQREVGVDILARRGQGPSVEPLLDLAPAFEVDQRLMLTRMQMQVPFRDGEIAGIERPAQGVDHQLYTHFAIAVLRDRREPLQEPLDLSRRAEPARGVALHRLLQDRGIGFVRHQHLAVARHLLVAVAEHRREQPIAVHHPCAHLLDHLAPVLLTLKLALGGQDGLDELALGGVLELKVQALDLCVPGAELAPELDVEFGVAGEALQIVKDDDVLFALLGIEIGQERHHAGPVHEVAAA